MAQPDGAQTFRRFLAGLPRASDFKFTNEVRSLLRQTLNEMAGLSEEELKIDPEIHNHFDRPCGRKFQRGEACYRCLTCGFDETCALCSYCFQPQFHKDHQVHKGIIQRESNGCCDCGDPEAYGNVHCNYFTTQLMAQTPSPPEFGNTINVALDYILDVMIHSYPCILPPKTRLDILHWSELSELDPQLYGVKDENSYKFALVLYNDQVHQYRDAVQRVRFATGKVTEFANMIVAKCNSFGKAIVMVSNDIDFLLKKQSLLTSTGLTACIRSCRDVFKENVCDEMILWISDLTNSMVVKNNKNYQGTICQAFLSRYNRGYKDLPILVHDLKNSEYSHNRENYDVALPRETLLYYKYQINFNPVKYEWDISPDLLKQCQYSNLSLLGSGNKYVHFEGSRFQYLAYFDIRFCKTIRTKLHDVYVSVILNDLKFKPLLTAQYVDIYIDLTTMFLTLDREPESSLVPVISTQVYTNPSSCTAIVEHGDMCKMLEMMDYYLRTGFTRDVASPYSSNKHGLLYFSLKNRKWGHIFLDMTYIISRNQINDNLFYYLPYFSKILDVLDIFQGKPTIKREATTHVEYELTDYGLYFNGMSVISHFLENISKSISKAQSSQICSQLVRLTINKLIQSVFMPSRSFVDADSGPNKVVENQEPPIEFQTLELNNISTRIVKFDVLSEKVSFLHPLHSFLSWCIEMSPATATEDLLRYLVECVDEIPFSFADGSSNVLMKGDYVKGIFDIPIRTFVLLSQIKTGLWVRNGLSIRNQMYIYKNSGIREFGYFRDLFLVQLFCSLETTDVSVPTLIDRWNLVDWCQGVYTSSPYTATHLHEMAEEFILFLINILTEDLHLHNKSATEIPDLRIRKEIIQTLCFKPVSYSKITSEISEHITSEKRFFLVFNQCVDEIPRKKVSNIMKEAKTYKLKEELYDEVDPYYLHYTSNKREDCLKVLKERIHNITKVPLSDVCVPPKNINWDDGKFKFLTKITCCTHFISILESSLLYCHESVAKGENSVDTLLDFTLHLIHVAVKLPNGPEFISFYLRNSQVSNLIYAFLLKEPFRGFYAKARAILKIICDHFDNNEQVLSELMDNFDSSRIQPSPPLDEMASDKKKRLGKKKRSQILAKFKKQQQKFAENYNFDAVDMMDIDEYDSNEEDNSWQYPHERCILCQMNANYENEPFGIISYVSQSNEFRSVPFQNKYWFYKAFSGNANLDEAEIEKKSALAAYLRNVEEEVVYGPGFPSNEEACNENHAVFNSCCHGMHFSCYLNFLKSVKTRQVSQITRTVPEDISRQEFLCPLCKAVNNIFIPIYYTSNKEDLNDKLKSHAKSILDPNLSNDLKASEGRLAEIKTSLISRVKANVKPEYWFVNDEDMSVQANSKSFLALNHTLTGFAVLTSPFDGVSAILTKTIESIEVSLRGVYYDPGALQLLIYEIPNQALTSLRVWNQFRDLIRNAETSTSTATHYRSFVSYPERLIGLWRNIERDDDLLYEGEDYFKLLVGAEEVPSIGMDFSKLLHLCYLKHIKQSLLILLSKLENATCSDNSLIVDLADLPYDSPKLDEIVRAFSASRPAQVGKLIYSMLVRLVTPFLRKSLIYAFVRFSVVTPGRLPDLTQFSLECDKLCAVMNLPTLYDVLEAMPLNEFRVSPEAKAMMFQARVPFPSQVKLISLPLRLNKFFSLYYNKLAVKPADPAICLFCAKSVNLQLQNYGDQLGSCNIHVKWECINAEFGIFFIPKSNCILLLNKGKGSFFESPYLDDYGEADEDSKKGHDLTLCKEKYDEFIRTVWLQHNIPNQIARKLEGQIDCGGWETL
ncbi:hypothetical protein OGAPHI_005436 [Ogataea philodendri]|uniref:E3 ubiquitin-protein ligase n=1 Tax=Ogataea philodendri TaxID=1378263 RepID=A0A9P8NYD8_9ASCO|nr:uncharacterized protein OGAPHI_005436 [Ogataea philodendri]KAH3662188.1 hypothetical protein OGAPHI_005436 [Ogataea philodendri]